MSWGPWIEHNGGRFPAHAKEGDTVLCVRTDGSEYGPFQTKGPLAVRWRRVVRYRIRKPRGMEVLESILAQPERELEAAQ